MFAPSSPAEPEDPRPAKLRNCDDTGADCGSIEPKAVRRTQTSEDWCWSICLTCEALQKAIREQPGVFLVTCKARTVFADRLAMTLRASGCIVASDARSASVNVRGHFPPARSPNALDARNRTAWFQRLETALGREPSAIPVIILDAADLLGHSAMCELVSILNGRGAGAKIRIVLIGRPELEARFHQSTLALVNDRLRFRRLLKPLSETDVRSIVAHRMPHDFAIGVVTVEALTIISNHIRSDPEKASELWRWARRLARDDGETTPTLTHAAKAAQMLVGNLRESGAAR